MRYGLALSLIGISTLTLAGGVHAEVLSFNLDGKHAPGMDVLNETHATTVTTPTGGEVGAGITYDTATNILDVNIAWGSANGFTDLTGPATDAHLHGPTANPAPAGFNDAAGVSVGIFSLAGFNTSATAGGFDGVVTLSELQEGQLIDGRLYINIHTTANTAGELRGHLVVVPEPATAGLLLVPAALLLRRRAQRG